jgi:hypothetical protein
MAMAAMAIVVTIPADRRGLGPFPTLDRGPGAD